MALPRSAETVREDRVDGQSPAPLSPAGVASRQRREAQEEAALYLWLASVVGPMGVVRASEEGPVVRLDLDALERDFGFAPARRPGQVARGFAGHAGPRQAGRL
jgi:hypothetical protein